VKTPTTNLAEVMFEPDHNTGSPVEAQAMQENPVELLRLQEICLGDKDFQRELIDVFLEDSLERIHTMETAMAEKNLEIFRLQAHSIKGASANAGAGKMTDIAANMEKGADGDALPPETPRMLEELKTEYEKVRAFLTRYVDEDLASL